MMAEGERKRRFCRRFAALQHGALAFPGELSHMQRYRRLGRNFPVFSTNETGCVCFPSFRLIGKGGEKAPWHDACGHDSAAEWTIPSARLVVSYDFFDGRLRPAASMFAAKAA